LMCTALFTTTVALQHTTPDGLTSTTLRMSCAAKISNPAYPCTPHTHGPPEGTCMCDNWGEWFPLHSLTYRSVSRCCRCYLRVLHPPMKSRCLKAATDGWIESAEQTSVCESSNSQGCCSGWLPNGSWYHRVADMHEMLRRRASGFWAPALYPSISKGGCCKSHST
jgi:hypothetical protein